MKICIFGLGYVGCVSAACLARDGHTVIGIDVNPQKVELIGAGRSPIIEPGLDEWLAEAAASGLLQASFDSQAAVQQADVSLICVGTPSNSNGSLNLRYIDNVCREIGAALAGMERYHVVVVRSTVLPGTVQERLIPLLEQHSGRRAGIDFGVCMNPEFLRESSALEDYYNPGQIVIGELDQRSGSVVERMYQAINAPVVHTDIHGAEMVKYACNAFHAVKVVFANEIGTLCKSLGTDGTKVMEMFVQDHRLNISPAYLKPGFAFGGSCLPKDLRALLYRAKEQDIECPMLNAILPSNRRHIERAIELIERQNRKKVGILGLSFKAGTDDVRESPIVAVVETLLGRGYEVSVYDENVEPNRLIGANKSFFERELPHIASHMHTSISSLVAEAEVIVVANGNPRFREALQDICSDQVVVDLVGIGKAMTEIGGQYEGIAW